MKLTLLGTGGPIPDPTRHGSAALLEIGGARLLFDAGRGVVLQLARAGIPVEEVGPVFLTHHHYDHIGDLADVILTGWLQGRRRPLRVFGPPGTESIVTALVERVYDRDIAFRSQGEHAIDWTPVESADVAAGLVHGGGAWQVFAEPVVHGHGLAYPEAFKRRWVCLGYRVEAEGKVVAFSGDCVECDGLQRVALAADVLVQCCYMSRGELTTPYFARLARETIACADSVGRIARDARVKKLVLTHFRRAPDGVIQSIAGDVARDYDGPVVLGSDLLEITI
jgi:ribonuclease BN (tRNA processing enzyme)